MGSRKTRPRLTTALLHAAATLAVCSLLASTTTGRRAYAQSVSEASSQSRAVSEARRGPGKHAGQAGVSFTYDSSLASDVSGEVARQEGCGKPGDILPARVAFTFADYPKPHESPFMTPPEIQLFPIEEYRRALAECEKKEAALTEPPVDYYVSDFDHEVRILKALNAERPAPHRLSAWLKKNNGGDHMRDALPFVPLFDMHEALRAKVSYIDFRGGRGVAFVALYTIEDTIATNQALAYVFQGLTSDGAYYVSAAFPIAAPFLPREYTTEEATRLGLGQTVLIGTKLERRYRNYLAATARRLEVLPSDNYRPDLKLLDDLLRSLDVNPATLKSYANPKRPE